MATLPYGSNRNAAKMKLAINATNRLAIRPAISKAGTKASKKMTGTAALTAWSRQNIAIAKASPANSTVVRRDFALRSARTWLDIK